MQEAMLSIIYVSVSLDIFIENIYSFCNKNKTMLKQGYTKL